MTSKKIKELTKIKDMTEFYGLGQNTISNYLKKLKSLEEEGFIPPIGKHNIVKALATYYFLNKLEDGEQTTELENIRDRINFIRDLLPMLDKDVLNEEQKENLKKQIKGYLDEIEETIDCLI